MYKKYIKDILTEKIKFKLFKEKEMYMKIKKCITENKNLKKKIRGLAYLSFFKKKNKKICRQKLICLINGRRRGVLSKFSLSRHSLNKLNLNSEIISLSKKSF